MKRIFVLIAICIFLVQATTAQSAADSSSIPFKLAEQQLIGYNNKNIEAFLLPYSDSVAIYQYPNTLLAKGKQQMRLQYADMFLKTPDLHCTVVNRMVLKNTVIDKESVVFKKGMPPFEAIAIYTIQNNKIQTVTFIQ